MTKKILTPAQRTIRAAQLSRRAMMRSAAAVGAVGMASPMLVKNAFSSSGEINLLMWSDEYPDPVIPNFEKATGIKVNQTPFSQNEEQINKLQATGGDGFDLVSPTCNRSPQYKDLAVLAPFDTNKLKHTGDLVPSMIGAAKDLWTWEDGLYYLPHCWGSEAISWRTDLAKIEYKTLSYGTLWSEEFKGKVQGRPHSLLLGLGLWMDGAGKLASNRMLDAYKNEDSMKKIYDVLLKKRDHPTAADNAEPARDLAVLLGQLSPAQRRAIVDTKIEGLSVAEAPTL